MKKENLYIIGAVAAVAGYFGYRYFKKKKAENAASLEAALKAKAEAEKSAGGTTGGSTTGGGVIYQGPTPYQRDVMKLQATVGTAIDGIVGPATNKAVEEYYPNSYMTYGPVTPMNIPIYLSLKARELKWFGK